MINVRRATTNALEDAHESHGKSSYGRKVEDESKENDTSKA